MWNIEDRRFVRVISLWVWMAFSGSAVKLTLLRVYWDSYIINRFNKTRITIRYKIVQYSYWRQFVGCKFNHYAKNYSWCLLRWNMKLVELFVVLYAIFNLRFLCNVTCCDPRVLNFHLFIISFLNCLTIIDYWQFYFSFLLDIVWAMNC